MARMRAQEAVKKLRTAARMSQRQFGETIGVTRGRVCHVERGRGTFRRGNLLKLYTAHGDAMAALGILPRDLLDVDDG